MLKAASSVIHIAIAILFAVSVMAVPVVAAAPHVGKVTPGGTIWIQPGEDLRIQCEGSPGVAMTFSIGEDITNIPMVESERGIYTGVYRVQSEDRLQTAQIVVTASEGSEKAESIGASVTVMRQDIPLILRLTGSPYSVLRTGPGTTWERLTHEAFPGTCLEVIGRSNDWFKVRLSTTQVAWVHRNSVELLSPGVHTPRSHLNNIHTSQVGSESRIRVKLSQPVVAQAIPDLESNTLRLRLFNVTMGVDQIRYDPDEEVIEQVMAVQTEDGVVDLYITQQKGALAGYKVRHSGEYLVITISKPLSPGFAGKRIVLDPGHGADPGAVGPAGTTEASITLAVAKELRRLLESHGAKVSLTREDNSRVPGSNSSDLYNRVDYAEAVQGDLFISIHANAAAGAAGRRASGSEVYFYYPIGGPLARMIQEEMMAATGNKPRFYAYQSFAVIRQTSMPAILVEIDFLSNPDMEAWMNTRAAQTAVAEGIFNGVKKYIGSVAGAPERVETGYISIHSSLGIFANEAENHPSLGWALQGFTPIAGKRLRWQVSVGNHDGTTWLQMDLNQVGEVTDARANAIRYRYRSLATGDGQTTRRHEALLGLEKWLGSLRLGAYYGASLTQIPEGTGVAGKLLAEANFQQFLTEKIMLQIGCLYGSTIFGPTETEYRLDVGIGFSY